MTRRRLRSGDEVLVRPIGPDYKGRLLDARQVLGARNVQVRVSESCRRASSVGSEVDSDEA